MKKVLSIILAVMVFATFVPMALAQGECEHVFNEETLVRPESFELTGHYICSACNETVVVKAADYSEWYLAMLALQATRYSIYLPDGVVDTQEACDLENEFADVIASMNISDIKIESEQAGIDALTDRAKEYKIALDAILKESGAVLVVDTTDYYFYGIYPDTAFFIKKYDLTEVWAMEERFPEEMIAAGSKATEDTIAYIRTAKENPEEASQEEFDAILKDQKIFAEAFFNCLEGKHDFSNCADNLDGTHSLICKYCSFDANESAAHEWGEYVPNGDGTKTASCKYCDATDTIGEKVMDLGKEITELINIFIKLIESLFAYFK